MLKHILGDTDIIHLVGFYPNNVTPRPTRPTRPPYRPQNDVPYYFHTRPSTTTSTTQRPLNSEWSDEDQYDQHPHHPYDRPPVNFYGLLDGTFFHQRPPTTTTRRPSVFSDTGYGSSQSDDHYQRPYDDSYGSFGQNNDVYRPYAGTQDFWSE